jgi:hypothetical protein
MLVNKWKYKTRPAGWLAAIFLALALAACGSDDGRDEPPPDPVALLTEAADNIRAAETFRLDVIQSGAPYLFSILIPGDEVAQVAFRRALAQYVAPDQLQASVRVILSSLPLDIDIYSRSDRQWFRMLGSGWVYAEYAPGFNPETLIADDSGFQAALEALTELEYIGPETLEDGTPVYHLRGQAVGEHVTDLLVGLIEAEGIVPVDVYVHRETRYPVRLVITQPETGGEDEQPTTWTIDVYDIDAEPEITPPEDN